MKNRISPLLLCCILSLLMTSCKYLPDWIGADNDEKLPGERIPVIIKNDSIQVDEFAAKINMAMPPAKVNSSFNDSAEEWPNLALASKFTRNDRVSTATGAGSDYRMTVDPIAAEGMIYLVDYNGEVFAHSADDINNVVWHTKLFDNKDDSMLSGGIAFDGGKLYITSSNGTIYCLSAADGKKLWQRSINTPLRSAPVVRNGNVMFVTSTNEIYSVSAEDGKTLWTFSGILQDTGILGSSTPAATDKVVVVPFSSGEVNAIDIETGQSLWADSLTSRIKNSSTGYLISDITASPVILDSTVFVGSSQNLLTAKEINSGQSVWEKKVSILKTPWVTKDFIFLISANDELICIHINDGFVKWITQLQKYEDESNKDEKLFYNGPILAGDRLVLINSRGKLLSVSPEDGKILDQMDIPDNIYLRPVVANNTLFLLDNSGSLSSYR